MSSSRKDKGKEPIANSDNDPLIARAGDKKGQRKYEHTILTCSNLLSSEKSDNPTSDFIADLTKILYKNILSRRNDLIDTRKNIRAGLYEHDGDVYWYRAVDEDNAAKPKSPEEQKNIENEQKKILIFNFLRLFEAYLLGALKIAQIYLPPDNDKNKDALLTIGILIAQIDDDVFATVAEVIDAQTTETVSETQHRIKNAIEVKKGELIANLTAVLADQKLLEDNPEHKSVEQALNHMLDKAKDWAALEMPSYPIYTVLPGEILHEKLAGQRIVIIDEPCTKLTEAQIDLIKNRNDRKWYQELSAFNKKMVDAYADSILSGDRVIPSQLRSIIPLGKNTYKQSIWRIDADENATLLNTYYHTGTPAYLSHKDSDTALEITRNNLQQQLEQSGTDESLMIVLNSAVGDTFVGLKERFLGHAFKGDDSEIIRLCSEAASGQEKLFYAKICLNGFRKVERNNYDGINHFIRIVISNLEILKQLDRIYLQAIDEQETKLAGYSNTPDKKEKADKAHIAITNINAKREILRRDTQKMETLRHKLSMLLTTKTMRDSNVIGTDIIYTLSQLATLNNHVAEQQNSSSDFVHNPTNKLKTMAIWFGCASGENRTGLAYYHNIAQTIIDHCSLNPEQTEAIAKIRAGVQASDHIHVMTGNQGSTFGTEGIRAKSSGSAKPYDPLEGLVHSAADTKSIPAQSEELNNAISALEKAIKDADKSNPAIANAMPYARRLLSYACGQRKKLFSNGMTANDRQLFCKALHTTAAWLGNPTQDLQTELNSISMEILSEPKNLDTSKIREAQEPASSSSSSSVVAKIPAPQNKPHKALHNSEKRSWKMVVAGCLLGVVAAGLITFSIMAAISSFGISTPLSAMGIALGTTLAAKAVAFSGIAAGAAALSIHSYIAHTGLIEDKNVAGLLDNIAKQTPRN